MHELQVVNRPFGCCIWLWRAVARPRRQKDIDVEWCLFFVWRKPFDNSLSSGPKTFYAWPTMVGWTGRSFNCGLHKCLMWPQIWKPNTTLSWYPQIGLACVCNLPVDICVELFMKQRTRRPEKVKALHSTSFYWHNIGLFICMIFVDRYPIRYGKPVWIKSSSGGINPTKIYRLPLIGNMKKILLIWFCQQIKRRSKADMLSRCLQLKQPSSKMSFRLALKIYGRITQLMSQTFSPQRLLSWIGPNAYKSICRNACWTGNIWPTAALDVV